MPSRYDDLPIREISLVTLAVARPDPDDELIATYAEPERLAWMHANFTDHSRVAALGDADSYATRLFDYEHSGRDQVRWVIDRLRADPTSRSATITMFQPHTDTTYIPCVSMLDFWLPAGAVELVVYAHSIDFGAKGYGNLVELASLAAPRRRRARPARRPVVDDRQVGSRVRDRTGLHQGRADRCSPANWWPVTVPRHRKLFVERSLEQPRLVGEHHCLDPVAQAELLQDVCDVRLYGRLADVELRPISALDRPVGDQPQDLESSLRQFAEFFRRGRALMRVNCLITRLVTAGDSSAFPAATVRTALISCSAGSSLSTKPLAPARRAS